MLIDQGVQCTYLSHDVASIGMRHFELNNDFDLDACQQTSHLSVSNGRSSFFIQWNLQLFFTDIISVE